MLQVCTSSLLLCNVDLVRVDSEKDCFDDCDAVLFSADHTFEYLLSCPDRVAQAIGVGNMECRCDSKCLCAAL